MAHDENRALWELKKIASFVAEIGVGDRRMHDGAIDDLFAVRRAYLDNPARPCEPFERLEKVLRRAIDLLVLRSDPVEREALGAILEELERRVPAKP